MEPPILDSKYSYGVDCRTLRWIHLADPPRAPKKAKEDLCDEARLDYGLHELKMTSVVGTGCLV